MEADVQAEVVALEIELLNVALAEEGLKLVALVVIQLHGHQFSRPG